MKTRPILLLLVLLLTGALLATACSAAPQPASAPAGAGAAHTDDHDAGEHGEEVAAAVEMEADAADADHDHAADADHDHAADADHDEEGGHHHHADPPAEFADLSNPFAGDEEAIAAGKTIFETNCVPCHGPKGEGDGPAAANLNPKPANLSDGDMMGMLSDGYLYWRVTEGGAMEPFNSAMPAWKTVLSEEQVWQVLSYVRTLIQ
ncbi:MAG: cytochrome c [Caldilineae bacterium]|nr:MAG: cytochrome c [Caldilineae bacterium]